MKLISQTTSPGETLSCLRHHIVNNLKQANSCLNAKSDSGRVLFQNSIATICGLVEMTARHLDKSGTSGHALRKAAEPLYGIKADDVDAFTTTLSAFSKNFSRITIP